MLCLRESNKTIACAGLFDVGCVCSGRQVYGGLNGAPASKAIGRIAANEVVES